MSENTFRRYTTLPFLLDILHEKRLPLLDPSSWEDKNDSYYLELYKSKKEIKSLLAICFADAPETYHHWKIYSGNSSGVCIVFNRDNLLRNTDTREGFISKSIDYKTIDGLRNKPIGIDNLPFVKRYAFKDEQEFRVIYESYEEEIKVKYIPILSDDIDSIIINPWVHKSVCTSIKSVLKGIDGFNHVRVTQSTVVENETWKTMGLNALRPKRKKEK